MKSLGIELYDDDKRSLYLYWAPKLHKYPVKHRFIACSSKCVSKTVVHLVDQNTYSHQGWTKKYCRHKDEPH